MFLAVADRYEFGSIVINNHHRAFRTWYEIFHVDKALDTAMIGRCIMGRPW